MRYWKPAPEFAGLVSGYHLYAVRPAKGERQRDVFQPAGAILRLTFGEPGDWRVRPPGGGWRAVESTALFGPTSGVTWSDTGPGLTIGIGILPRGWLCIAREEAAAWTNRIADPAQTMLGDADGLRRSLACATSDEEVPKVLDRYLCDALGQRKRSDPRVSAFETALLDPQCASVTDLAGRVGTSVRSIERLARSAFGFPPKLLMRRARFLRSLHAVAEAPANNAALAIDPGYTDYSHFVRDAQEFLGMSPQAFLKLDNPMLKQSLTLRRKVLGAPAQALAS